MFGTQLRLRIYQRMDCSFHQLSFPALQPLVLLFFKHTAGTHTQKSSAAHIA